MVLIHQHNEKYAEVRSQNVTIVYVKGRRRNVATMINQSIALCRHYQNIASYAVSSDFAVELAPLFRYIHLAFNYKLQSLSVLIFVMFGLKLNYLEPIDYLQLIDYNDK